MTGQCEGSLERAMKENSIRRAVREGRAALGTGLKEFASRGVPRIIEAAGFDYCAIDHEHGAFDMETIANLASWFQATNVSAIVRIHKSFAHLIPGILDQGIMGIQVSEVENAEEARAIVHLAKYPPIGNRGISGQGPHTGYKSYGPRHATVREHHHIPVDRVARRPGECREDCGGRRHRHDSVWAFRPERTAWGPPRPRAPEIQSGGASDRGGMHCTRQARSGIGGDRVADRGILAARMQGAEPAGERREHVSRRNESARGPCTCAVEVDWGADPMRGSGGYLIILITTP
jgi:hypothetical protein